MEGRLAEKWGAGLMLIPAPREVNEIMRRIPQGSLTTIQEIRAELARKHEADYTCPITTGIFAWISAHAAEEAGESGTLDITPYWRTLKTGGELNPKYPGGIEELRRKLESEGHEIEQRGKKVFVKNFETALAST
jgi:hypothetical protein